MSNRAERVLRLLESRPDQDIPAAAFEAPGGRQAWRTAISEARRIAKEHGGDIVYRPRYVKDRDGKTITLSFYRYVPGEPRQLALRESA